jgi:2'-5' RNA ligase
MHPRTTAHYFALLAPDPVRAAYRKAGPILHDEFGIRPLAYTHEAHLTIKAPFLVADGRHGELIERVAAIASAQPPVAATLGASFKCFPESGTIYLAVDDMTGEDEEAEEPPVKKALGYFLDAFAAMGFRRRGYEGMTPHVTFARDVPRPKLGPALSFLNHALRGESLFGAPVVFERAALFKRNPALDDAWEASRLFALGAAAVVA